MPVPVNRTPGQPIAAADINNIAQLANDTETGLSNVREGTKRWQGDGPPGTITGSAPGDEYLDLLTGDLYILG